MEMIRVLIPTTLVCLLSAIPFRLPPSNNTQSENCMSLSSNALENEVKRHIQDKVASYLDDRYGVPCGKGEWTKVAEVNMSAPNSVCPQNWTLLTNEVRGCGRLGNSRQSSAQFSVNGKSYTQVCGRVLAVQKGTTDAFGPYYNQRRGFNDAYLDGVSLSYFPSTAREHIWSFAAAFSRVEPDPARICPCHTTNWPLEVPTFVGDNYFCESGSSFTSLTTVYYTNDTLWNGQGCEGTASNCCSFNNPPWFYASLPQPTTSNLELRILANGLQSEENVIVTKVELYVQ